MKQLLIIILALTGFTTISAQTKKISFKSHSGNEENFPVVMEEALFDMDESNFGLPPNVETMRSKLDSVIYVSDSVAILVTSNAMVKRNAEISDTSKAWRPDRKTIYLDPLFSKKHSLDSIKSIIQQQYYYQNPIDKVVFVGYDNKDKKNNFFIPITNRPSNNDGDSFNRQFFSVLGYIVALSLLALIVILQYYKNKEKKLLTVSA